MQEQIHENQANHSSWGITSVLQVSLVCIQHGKEKDLDSELH